MTLSNQYPLAVFPASVVLPAALPGKEPCDPDALSAISEQPSGSAALSEEAVEISAYFAVKQTIDWLLTAMLLVIALPLIVVVSIAILLVDGRPVFYRQTRVGKAGRRFRIWKFRTMVPNAENATGAVWSSVGDPRVTRLGHWLRTSHLDELPQLLNVLSGEMGLIGPRPERPEFVRELAAELPSYMERLGVRPGITGLAQLRLGYDQSVDQVRKKVQLDIEYIQTASLYGDALLGLATLPYVLSNLRENFRKGERCVVARDEAAGVVAETVPHTAPRIYKPDFPHDSPRSLTLAADRPQPISAMALKRV